MINDSKFERDRDCLLFFDHMVGFCLEKYQLGLKNCDFNGFFVICWRLNNIFKLFEF